MHSCLCAYRWYYIVVVPVTPASLRKWENPEDMDIHEVGGRRVFMFYHVNDANVCWHYLFGRTY